MTLLKCILFFLICGTTHSQELIINPFYKGEIVIYGKPGTAIIYTIKNDDENEDYLFLKLEKQDKDYFFGILSFGISKKEYRGWIKKADYIGLYARNYSEGITLNLYSESDTASMVKSYIPGPFNEFCMVLKTNAKWVYITTKYQGQKKEGWLEPSMQCANPYTTCN